MVINTDLIFDVEHIRKIFGEKELDIIKKQINGITLTHSEKNRLSRDIRTKLIAIKHISESNIDYSLKHNCLNIELIDKAVSVILSDMLKDKIHAILLFGSQISGRVTFRSDIDICVVFDKVDLKEATKFRIRISGEFPKKVDVQVFNILPQKIKFQIAKNHQVLYKCEKFDNLLFSIRYLKDTDYFFRMKKRGEKI